MNVALYNRFITSLGRVRQNKVSLSYITQLRFVIYDHDDIHNSASWCMVIIHNSVSLRLCIIPYSTFSNVIQRTSASAYLTAITCLYFNSNVRLISVISLLVEKCIILPVAYFAIIAPFCTPIDRHTHFHTTMRTYNYICMYYAYIVIQLYIMYVLCIHTIHMTWCWQGSWPMSHSWAERMFCQSFYSFFLQTSKTMGTSQTINFKAKINNAQLNRQQHI